MLKVSRRPEPLATAKASAALVYQLRPRAPVPPDLLAALRTLLRRHPVKAVGRREQACDEPVTQGRSPTWPDNGEADAFAALVAGLGTLPTRCRGRRRCGRCRSRPDSTKPRSDCRGFLLGDYF